MKIALASDHAGFEYKEKIKKLLSSLGHSITDFGTKDNTPCDYPDFIKPAAKAVSERTCERGIVLGGSGNGEAMVANRFKNVRCSLCWNEESARLARQHNDANMLSLGARLIDEKTALKIVELWLTTQFEGGRHSSRLSKFQ